MIESRVNVMSTTALVALLFVVASEPKAKIVINSYSFDKQFSIAITDAAIRNSPDWKSDRDTPPIPPREAMKRANDLKSKLVVESDEWKWKMASISLTEADTNKWYWIVNYEAEYQKGTQVGIPPTLRLVVLMDGTVVEPKVTDLRKKK